MHASQEGEDMDRKDNVGEQCAALAQQREGMDAPPRMVERRLRWWPGLGHRAPGAGELSRTQATRLTWRVQPSMSRV